MAAVLPESMDKIDPKNPKESIETIDHYIRYMAERIEFNNRNFGRLVTSAGVSSAELLVLLTALQTEVASIKSQVGKIQGDLTGVTSQIGEIYAEIKALDERVKALENPVPPPAPTPSVP